MRRHAKNIPIVFFSYGKVYIGSRGEAERKKVKRKLCRFSRQSFYRYERHGIFKLWPLQLTRRFSGQAFFWISTSKGASINIVLLFLLFSFEAPSMVTMFRRHDKRKRRQLRRFWPFLFSAWRLFAFGQIPAFCLRWRLVMSVKPPPPPSGYML